LKKLFFFKTNCTKFLFKKKKMFVIFIFIFGFFIWFE